MKKQEIRALVETGIFVGIAVVLDLIFGAIYSFPFGGSIGVAMLPIFIIASRRGPKYGIIAGILYGLIQTMIKVYFLNFFQYFLDYFVAFGVVGIGAFIPKTLLKRTRFIILITVGSLARWIIASIAGVVYWAEYIPGEMEWVDGILGTNIVGSLSESMLIFVGAFIYNSLYMIPSMLLCILVGVIIHNRGVLQFNLTQRVS
ncbi:MAG: energy-coupled thiamine transporter ThiT [Tenericutes bacterium]|nr:energy-coupled thiamine transporter ThiT [Mycoplasmatota bacterium]